MQFLVRCIAISCALLIFSAAQDPPESVRKPNKRFDRRVVVSGLDHPWEITWGPDNMLWVTERSGKRITRVNQETGERRTAATLSEVVAPGGQEGLLGLALPSRFLTGDNSVYVAYHYIDRTLPPDARVTDPASIFRNLYGKVVRLTYDPATQTLHSPVTLIKGLPAGNDHNAMRLKVGPDEKLYLTIGDQGNNQLGNFCLPILSQRLPTQAELAKNDYAAYEGKSLRLNLDGSIPEDNPKLEGVVSHIYTYGHRNTQGIDFAPDGTLYAAEHGPKTDDEIDVLVPGGNYGWPHVAGFRDNKAFQYARWADAKQPCGDLKFSDLEIHPAVPREDETAFTKPMVDPLATLFTVPTGSNFADPKCKGVNYICWPTVGISGVEHYAAGPNGIPGWDRVLLITTLKRGSLYILPLTPDGKKAAGKMFRFFRSENRYRDTAVHPNRRTIYVATDSDGVGESLEGSVFTKPRDRGAILAFTYAGEGEPAPEVPQAAPTQSEAKPEMMESAPTMKAAFTAKQLADGKSSYQSNCAVCHGNTMTNGTFGTPLAGEYFKTKWSGKSVGALFQKSRTMPPAAPRSLPDAVYANVVAYILSFNGHEPGDQAMPAGGDALGKMRIE
jgi:PQQ-dependent dehydrogenase (s-GDH family)